MSNLINIHYIKSQRGVTLLLAVLFLTAGLSISLGIFYIVFVQLQINRVARDSHLAFYAADTGKECAAYYREYVGNPLKRGFWSPINPCNDSDGDGSDCALAASAPVCAGMSVLKPSTMCAGCTPQAGVDYTPGTDPAPPNALGNPPDAEGTSHIFKFSTDPATGICVGVEIEVLKRRVDTQDDIRIITHVDGLSSCSSDKKNVINQSFDECRSSRPGGCNQ